MNRASENKPVSRLADFPWVVFLLGLGTILINAGFLAAFWHVMRHSEEQQHQAAEQTQAFHVELLDKLKHLTNHMPASATEDLCQVRFRLRFSNGVDVPLTQFRAELFRVDPVDRERLTLVQSLWAKQPILNFGFLPPGEYRLSLENSWGMKCDRDFRILPGVPVDRVAYCPMPASWIHQRPPFALKIQSVWPTEWHSQPIVAVYHLQASGPDIEGWKWQAPQTKQFHHWVVAGNLRGPLREKNLCDVLPDSLFEQALPPELECLPPEGIPVGYGSYELMAISFLLDQTHTQDGYVYLGSCRFAGERDAADSKTPQTQSSESILSESAPRWDIESQPSEGFPIQIPRAMISLVAERAKLISQGDPTVQMDRPRSRGPSRSLDSLDPKPAQPTRKIFASPVASL